MQKWVYKQSLSKMFVIFLHKILVNLMTGFNFFHVGIFITMVKPL